MPTLSFSLTGSTVVNGTKAYTISDPDVQRLVNAMIGQYSPPPDQGPPLTAQQALLALVQQQWVNTLIQQIVNFEMAEQVKAIIITPPVFAP